MKRIKIIQLVHSMGMAGAEKVVYSIIKNLDKTKFSFYVYCLDFIGELGKRLLEEGVEVVTLDRMPGVDFNLTKKLARVLKENNIDIVHAHQYTPYFYGATAAMFNRKCKVIFTEHGRHQPDYIHIKRVIYNQFLNLGTNSITGVSRFSKDSLVKYEKLPANKIKVIYNGVSINKNNIPTIDKQAKMQELGLKDSETIIAMIGRFSLIKNHKMLLKAFQRVLKEMPDVKLVLIGEGPTKQECECLARDLNILKHILFTGLREDLSELLQVFDICVLSSDAEAMSLFLLESMAAGLPVIATEGGGNPEIVINGETGVLVPPKDYKAFANAIIDLAKDSKKRQQMGKAGRDRVSKFFNLDNMLAEYEKLYLALN